MSANVLYELSKMIRIDKLKKRILIEIIKYHLKNIAGFLINY